MAVLLMAGAAGVTASSWAARWHWASDLLSHFVVQSAACSAGSLAILSICQRRVLAGVASVLLLINLSRIVPMYLAEEPEVGSGPTVRALAANLHRDNREHDRFIDLVQSGRPDFFVVMEIGDDWVRSLQGLSDSYPYSIAQPREDNFGIALFSRWPIKGHRVHDLSQTRLPTLVASLDVRGQELTILATHPLPPIGRARSELRNQQLAEVGMLAANLPNPKLILGDLNITSWSPYFSELLRRSGMRDGRCGSGVQPSWPALPWLFRIPIDHTLVSADIHVVHRELGPPIGSDHRPVVIEFRVRNP
jgi:endonuclease/exonuclease/phosphatase (EEP) superfamily protein YafD